MAFSRADKLNNATNNFNIQYMNNYSQLQQLYNNDSNETNRAGGIHICSNLSTFECHQFENVSPLVSLIINKDPVKDISCDQKDVQQFHDMLLSKIFSLPTDSENSSRCLLVSNGILSLHFSFRSQTQDELTSVHPKPITNVNYFMLHFHSFVDLLFMKELFADASSLYSMSYNILLGNKPAQSLHLSLKPVAFRLLNSLGSSLYLQKRWKESLESFTSALSMCSESDMSTMGRTYSNLGASLYKLAQHRDAKTHYERAVLAYNQELLSLSTSEASHPASSVVLVDAAVVGKARSLSSLGTTLRALGCPCAARDKYEEALDLYSSFSSSSSSSSSLDNENDSSSSSHRRSVLRLKSYIATLTGTESDSESSPVCEDGSNRSSDSCQMSKSQSPSRCKDMSPLCRTSLGSLSTTSSSSSSPAPTTIISKIRSCFTQTTAAAPGMFVMISLLIVFIITATTVLFANRYRVNAAGKKSGGESSFNENEDEEGEEEGTNNGLFSHYHTYYDTTRTVVRTASELVYGLCVRCLSLCRGTDPVSAAAVAVATPSVTMCLRVVSSTSAKVPTQMQTPSPPTEMKALTSPQTACEESRWLPPKEDPDSAVRKDVATGTVTGSVSGCGLVSVLGGSESEHRDVNTSFTSSHTTEEDLDTDVDLLFESMHGQSTHSITGEGKGRGMTDTTTAKVTTSTEEQFKSKTAEEAENLRHNIELFRKALAKSSKNKANANDDHDQYKDHGHEISPTDEENDDDDKAGCNVNFIFNRFLPCRS